MLPSPIKTFYVQPIHFLSRFYKEILSYFIYVYKIKTLNFKAQFIRLTNGPTAQVVSTDLYSIAIDGN